ncbi:MAG TPA: hypothetical protein ENK57_01775 [Polyangiaceae bacterium]|nr:hypothetical protein [Polyangiaceae bacterium]
MGRLDPRPARAQRAGPVGQEGAAVTRRTLPAIALALLLLGCGSGATESTEVDTSAHDFDGDECAACGMIVSEQPSPRGQVIHRDGTRAYACALADMHTYASAPSGHGQVIASYVEVLPPDADPADSSTAPERWVPAEEAFYVLGVVRNNVMGQPVLSYATRADAEQAAERFGGHVVDYAGLQDALDEGQR